MTTSTPTGSDMQNEPGISDDRSENWVASQGDSGTAFRAKRMSLEEAIEIVRRRAHEEEDRVLLDHAEAWAWCVEHEARVDVGPGGRVYVIVSRFEEDGPDLPSAVAEARKRLEGSR